MRGPLLPRGTQSLSPQLIRSLVDRGVPESAFARVFGKKIVQKVIEGKRLSKKEREKLESFSVAQFVAKLGARQRETFVRAYMMEIRKALQRTLTRSRLDMSWVQYLYTCGMSLRELASILDMSPETVRKIVVGEMVSEKTLRKLHKKDIADVIFRKGWADPQYRPQVRAAIRYMQEQGTLGQMIGQAIEMAMSEESFWDEFREVYEGGRE